ncbi:MAG: signal peptidase I [Planctomycetota bacterium]
MSESETNTEPADTTSTPEAPEAETTPGKKKKKEKPEPRGLWHDWIRPLLTVIIIVTTLRSSLLDWNDVPTGSMIPTVAIGDRIVVNKLSYGFNLPFNGPVVSVPFINVTFDNPLDFLPGFYYGEPKRNDIVTFWKPSVYDYHYQAAEQQGFSEAEADAYARARDDAGTRMVKRVVAVPGDTVEMRRATEKFDGRLFEISKLIINGEEAQYTDKYLTTLTETILGDVRRVKYDRYTSVEAGDGRTVRLNPRPQALAFGPITLGDDEYLMIGDNRDNSADGRFFGPVKLDQITGKAKFVAVSFNGSYFKPNWSRFFHAFDSDIETEAP